VLNNRADHRGVPSIFYYFLYLPNIKQFKFKYLKITIYRKKEANPAPGWGKGSFRKLRAALRPGWLLNDTRLLGNTDEEFDTGIDLTEADFIPEDTEVEPEAAGYFYMQLCMGYYC